MAPDPGTLAHGLPRRPADLMRMLADIRRKHDELSAVVAQIPSGGGGSGGGVAGTVTIDCGGSSGAATVVFDCGGSS